MTSQILCKQALKNSSLVFPKVTTCTTARLSRLNLTVEWDQTHGHKHVNHLQICDVRSKCTKSGVGDVYALSFQITAMPVRRASMCSVWGLWMPGLKMLVEPEKKGRKLMDHSTSLWNSLVSLILFLWGLSRNTAKILLTKI